MRKHPNLDYLYNKPKVVIWKHVVGPEVNPCQMYDLVFDEYDYKIRNLSYKQVRNGKQDLKGLQEAQRSSLVSLNG